MRLMNKENRTIKNFMEVYLFKILMINLYNRKLIFLLNQLDCKIGILDY